MHTIESILERYDFTNQDEALLREIAQLCLPVQDRVADDFYLYLKE